MAQNAVRSVQTHSSPRVIPAREIATLTCIAKKNSQVGVSKITLMACGEPFLPHNEPGQEAKLIHDCIN